MNNVYLLQSLKMATTTKHGLSLRLHVCDNVQDFPTNTSLLRLYLQLKQMCCLLKFREKRKLTINERVRSGMPVSFTQASITPWISAVMVEPEQEGGCEKSTGSKI